MTRTPIDVYRGLMQARIGDDAESRIGAVVGRFADYIFAGQNLSEHLTRFIKLCSKLTTYLDTRYVAGLEDLTIAVDVLDHITSTTKWWGLSRKEPGIILKPRLRDPREFMKSVGNLQVGSGSLNRISGAADKLSRFLDEHGDSEPAMRENLCESLVSTWVLLSAFICKNQGRNVTDEQDFEIAYDFTRILLFYTSLDDLRALVACRLIATNQKLPLAASVGFSHGFERKLDSSMAARLEREHQEYLGQITISASNASRAILTNSLRFLSQLKAFDMGLGRIEETHYESLILASIHDLEKIGVSSDNLDNESSVVELFQKLKSSELFDEHLAQLTRRLEGLIIDSTGNRDFLLQYSKLVPMLISLLLLLLGTTKTGSEPLKVYDIKRGLLLLNRLLAT
ncbi:MAG: hypothetical protein ACTSUO_02220 [Candidatus Thorarchaeota archaeon]